MFGYDLVLICFSSFSYLSMAFHSRQRVNSILLSSRFCAGQRRTISIKQLEAARNGARTPPALLVSQS